MSRSPWDERFVDMLLRETLGGEAPPSIRARVLARVETGQARVRRWYFGAALAAAAVVAMMLSAWWLWPQTAVADPYPPPVIAGVYELAADGPLARGAVVRSTAGAAELELGGYVQIAMDPRTHLELRGEPDAEEVFLDRGKIQCSVRSGEGRTFAVQTEVGTASVVGTVFTVQVEEEEMKTKQMTVRVLAGAVLVAAAAGGQERLQAQEVHVEARVDGDGIQVTRDRKSVV